jgi:hypothetical protein
MIKLVSIVKYILYPAWRRSYKLCQLVHRGLTAQEAMARLGIITVL